MGEYLYWLTGYWVELIKMYFMVGFVFRCKLPVRLPKVIIIMSGVVLILPVLFASNTLISGLIVIATMITMMNLMEKKREILIALLSMVIISIVDVIFSGIMGSILDIRINEIIDNYTISTLMNMQSLIPLFLLVHFMGKKEGLQKISYSEKALKQVVIITVGLCSVILFFVPIQVVNINVNDGKNKISLLALVVGVLFFVGMALANVVIMIKKEQSEKDNKVYRYLLEKQKQLYENLLEHENETKRFRHDVYHHMNCIKEYLTCNQTKQAIEYIDSVYGLIHYAYFISTGNTCLDIVINNVWKDYRDKVRLKWNGMFPPQIKISDIDICILFSNLFRNALEATAEAEEEREISASTKVMENNIVFTLTNPYVRVNRGEKDGLRSTKSVHRGYGMRNIQEIVEKYSGRIDIRIEDLFTVEIVLSDIVGKA